VILRIVRGEVPSGALEGLAEGFATSVAPAALATPGLERHHVAVRPRGAGHALVEVTSWASVDDAIAAFDGDLETPRTVDAMAASVDLDDVAHFEVDETVIRRGSDGAAVLRISTGRVAQGIDAAIQAELRTLVTRLDDAMIEACVGRRIVGSDVEIVFVSAWDRVPAGMALEEPFWPDLSAQYDEFAVETFVPLLGGHA
jgi:hypothetical protein